MINQRYILKQQLGQGRSKVYSVIDTEFPEKEIAMKILPADVTREEKDSFRQEYFTIKKLDHPNIIKAYDLGTILTIDDEDSDIKLNSLFITLEQFNAYELLDYPSLRNEEELVTIIKQTCSVLYYLHQSNYIYYDLKPQNILVSRDNNRIIIKIIDLGFARNILSDFDHSIRGTAEYLAPELLKKEPHDHTVDLYSLGIILYQIVYEKYPFNLKTELEIYKAHIDGNFDYPVSTYSEKIINIIKKLLNKDPNERYTNTLEVLFDLGIDVNQEITKDFLPAKVLSGRKDTLNILRTYFNDKSSNEIFSIRGFSGAGKSQVLFETHSIYPQSVYIENTRRKTGIELIRFFLYSLLYSDGIFQYTSSDDQDNINQFFTSGEFEVSDSFKSLLSRITENKHILLLVDDYNLYDDFARETINDILPILQINKIKVVIAESSEYNYATEKLYNIQTINLTPFTERQLSEYLELSYYPNFPKNKLKKVILDYADLLPGSIVQFIKDILILGVMHYLSNEVTFVYKDNIEKSLKGSNEEIYRLRLSNLSNDELKVTQLISAFSISVEQIVLASVLNKSQKEIEEILLNLQYKNIINPLSISNSPNITSDSFKRYIYNTIKEKKKYHFIIASLIKRILPEFNIIEHARHYKLAGEIIKVVELINIEIKRAENLSAYGYKKKLIEDLLQLQINNDIKTSLLIELVNTLYKLSDFNKAIDQASKIEIESVDMKVRNDLKFIIGSSLISLRRIPVGIEILNELLKSDIESSFQHKVLVEIAYAEFELNNYKDSEKIALDLLKYNDLYDEEKGKCYNLLGMIKIYANEDINSAIGNFNNALKMYQKAQLPRRVAGVEVNLGNIYNMIGDDENSEKHWGNALKINESIGNLEQEAAILINYGVYFLYKYKIDKSIQYLTRSDKIFSAIGNKVNQGLVSINLGEVFMLVCEYQNSFDVLSEAVKIFDSLQNYEELANTIYDLGKLSYQLNNPELLDYFIVEYENCIGKKELSDKYSINLSILKIFKVILHQEPLDYKYFKKIIDEFIRIGETKSYIDSLILAINRLVNNNKNTNWDIILALLRDKQLLKLQNENFLLAAYREYFLGKISINLKDPDLSPPIEHFEKAYSLIENETITELTWQVLFAISQSYLERGFINKAKKPLIYAAELLNYIADNIKKSDFRTKYLNESERAKVFNRLKSINTPIIAK